MKIFAETERLILREILPTDFDGMFELDSNAEVHRYLGNNPVSSNEEVINNINLIRQQYIDNGIGRWAIINKENMQFIGWTGLRLITHKINNHSNYYDLGYRLIQNYWGKGLATESAIASLHYAFNTLKLTKVYAIADCQNKGSNNILLKVGMNFIESFDLDGTMHNWYEIDNELFSENLKK